VRAIAVALDALRLLDEIRTVQHELAGIAAGTRFAWTRVVIGTSSKGDTVVTDGFSIGRAFFERHCEEIRAFLGVAALGTRERPSDS